MDWEAELRRLQQQFLDLYDSAVAYFDSLETYGLIGWALLVVGVLLLFAGAILLAV